MNRPWMMAPHERPIRLSLTREQWALAALLLATTLYWTFAFHPFLVPNNDFYTFEDAARSMAEGRLPLESKRLPLFPALMGLLSRLLGGEHPELQAALLWNAAFSLATLALLFRLASRAIGPGGVLVPVLVAATVPFQVTGLQPLVEPSLAFTVVLTFVLFQARSPWQYAAAAAVGLGRYDALTLVPVMAAVNGFAEGKPGRHALLGLLAASPVLLWRALAALTHPDGGSYLDLMAGMGFAPAPSFAVKALEEALAPLRARGPLLLAFALPTALPLLVGIRSGLRECRRDASLLLLFFVSAVAAVVVFGVPKARYAAPVAWIPVLFWVWGAFRLCEVAAPRLSQRTVTLIGTAGALGLLGVLIADLGAMHQRPSMLWFPVAATWSLTLVALAAVPLLADSQRIPRPLGLVALACAALLVTTSIARVQTSLRNVRYANYGSWQLAEWARGGLEPTDAIVVLNVGAFKHLTGLPNERVRNFAVSGADSPAELAAYMRSHGITHVGFAWRRAPESSSAHYYHRRKNVDLAREFANGAPVEQFEYVTRLEAPASLDQGDAHVYRVLTTAAD